MSAGPMSPDEQRQLRLVHLVVHVVPPAVGLLTFTMIASRGRVITNDALADTLMVVVFWVNHFLAGAGAAWAVARMHPVRRGAWWRAGVAFVIAFASAFAIFFAAATIASSFGYHL